MFLRDRRPRSALHLLCNAAAGCSVAGLALLAEERRRRIALAQKIVDNGRRLQAYKAYHGNAAIAVFEDNVSCHFDPGQAPAPRAAPHHVPSNEPRSHTLTNEEWSSRRRYKASLPTRTDTYDNHSSTLDPSEEPFPLDRWKTRMHATEQVPSTNNTSTSITPTVSSHPISSASHVSHEARPRLPELAGQRIFSDERAKRARAVHKIQLALKDGIKARLARAESEEARLQAYAELYFYFAFHHESVSVPLRDFVEHLRGQKGDHPAVEKNGKTWQMLSHDMRAVIEDACSTAQYTTLKASHASKLSLNLRTESPSSGQNALVEYLLHLITNHRPGEAYLALTMACPNLIGPLEPALRTCARLIIDTYKAIGCSTLVLELHKTFSLISKDVSFFRQDLDFLLGQESGPMRLYICQSLLNSSLSGMPLRPAMSGFLETCLEWLLANDGCAAAAFVFTRLSTGRVPVSDGILNKTLPAIGIRIRDQAQHENNLDLSKSVDKVLSNHELRKLRHAAGAYHLATTSGSPRQMQQALKSLSEILASKNMRRILSASVRLRRRIDNSHALLLKRTWAMTNNLALLEHSCSEIRPILVSRQASHDIFQIMGIMCSAAGNSAKADHYLALALNPGPDRPSIDPTRSAALAESRCQDWPGVEAAFQEAEASVKSCANQLYQTIAFEELMHKTSSQSNPRRTVELAIKLHHRSKARLTPNMCQKIMHGLINEEQLDSCFQWLEFCASENLDLHMGNDTLSLICDRLGLFSGAGSKIPIQDQNDFRFALVLHFLRNAQDVSASSGLSGIQATPLALPSQKLSVASNIGDAHNVGAFTLRRHGHIGADKTVNDENVVANNTMRAMRRAMTAGKPSNALDIYREATTDGFPLRPSLLSAAVDASIALDHNSTSAALAMIRAAEEQGMCATTARRIALMQELGDIPMSEDDARSIVFGDYMSVESSKLTLDHLVFHAVAQRLAYQRQPEAILRLSKEAYSSQTAKERPFSRWLIVELMKIFISADYVAGVRWVHNTVCQNMRPTRHYLTVLQQAQRKTGSPLMAEMCTEAVQRRDQQKTCSRRFLEQFAMLLRR